MPSLTTCLRRAGPYLSAEDKKAILKKAAEFKKGGMDAQSAAVEAVNSVLETVRGALGEFKLTSPTKEDVLRQQEDAAAEEKERAVPRFADAAQNPDTETPKTDSAPTVNVNGAEAAQWLAGNASEPYLKVLAEKMQPLLGNTSIQYVENGKPYEASVPKEARAAFRQGIAAVSMTDVATGKSQVVIRHDGEGPMQDLLSHELLHAASEASLLQPGNEGLRAELNGVRETITKKLSEIARTSEDPKAREAAEFFAQSVDNEFEALAYGSTSPTLKAWMQTVDINGDPMQEGKQSLWRRFVSIVRRLVGLPKLYANRVDAALADGQVATLSPKGTLAAQLDEMLDRVLAAAPKDGKVTAVNVNTEARPAKAAALLAKFDKGPSTVGDTGRYTEAQREAFRHVGRETTPPTRQERLEALWTDIGKKMRQGIVDQFAPVKDISDKAYGLLRLSKGASGAFETLLKGGKLKLSDGVYDFNQDKRGGVIDRLLKPLQGEHHDFLWWVAANRAASLKERGKENLFSDADIAAIKDLDKGTTGFDYTLKHGVNAGTVTRDRSLIYPDSLRTFNEFGENVLDMAEQSGLIDGEARDLWENEFYVPFYRVEDDGTVAGADIKNGAVRQQAFATLTGRTNKLNSDLLDNTLMNWAHLLDAAAKNRAAKATIEAAESMGGAQKIEAPQGKGSVWFRENGEKRHSFVTDPFLLDAVSALAYNGMRSPVMDAMGKFKRALTIGVTSSPFFKVRNLIRDSVQVIGTSPIGYNPAKNIAEGWKLTDPKSDAYFRLLAGGGTIHFGTNYEGSEAKRVQRLVEHGVDPKSILDSQGKIKAFYKTKIAPAIEAYEEIGNRGEAINRAALYAQLTKQGMGHAEASLMARDLMDFSMQGTFQSVRFLTQVVPFFNARIQGLYKLGKAAKEDPARFAAVLGATSMAGLALMLAYSDDEDWKKRENWDRNNNWWFKIGGEAFRIPKPFEIGAIATLAERTFELAFDDEMTGKRFRSQLLTLLSDNLSMNPIPQLVKPMIDVYANKDSFTGRAIEPMSVEKLKSEYRFDQNTSMTARAASTIGNTVASTIGGKFLSPMQIDHLLQGYFGWLGATTVAGADAILRPLTDQSERPATDYLKVATGGIASDLRDAPSRYVTQMYQQMREINEAFDTYSALRKQGKAEEAQEFRDDNAALIAAKPGLSSLQRRAAEMSARAKSVQNSSVDADSKRESIRQIRESQDALARTVRYVQ